MPGKNIRALLADDEQLWLGIWGGGLIRLDLPTGTFNVFQPIQQPRPGQQISITISPGASGGTGIIQLLPIITPTRPLRPCANFGFTLQTGSGGGLRLATVEIFSTPITIELRYTDGDVIGLKVELPYPGSG